MMNTGTHLNKSDIESIIPHRDPVLLAESAFLAKSGCETALYIDPGFSVFKGHFPDEPVFPGACICEAMAQCAVILLLSIPENAGKKPFLFSVQRLRFLRAVHPGDTLTCKASFIDEDLLTSNDVHAVKDMFEFSVSAYTEEGKVANGAITLSLR